MTDASAATAVPAITRLLLIEDDPGTTAVLDEVFCEEGYTVHATHSAEAALAMVQDGSSTTPLSPDLIVLDLKLPSMNGLEFAAAYRRLPVTQAPIVLLTASQPPSADVIAQVGIADVAPKPFELPDLLARLRTAIQT